jgi:hypothetical protein
LASHFRPPYRSLFWPIILIGIGLLWLLNSIGNIVDINLPVFFRLWPLLLIFIGLDFLLGRRHPFIGAALGATAILIVVGFILGGRVLGLSPDVQIKTEHFRAPIEGAQSSKVTLVLSDSPATIQALSNSADIIDAQLTYIGSIIFHVSGKENKTIQLARNEADFLLFSPLYWDPSLQWQIGLTSQIPLELDLEGGSGSSQIDLSQLKMNSIKANMGSGSSNWVASGVGQPSIFTLKGGSGSIQMSVPEGAQLTLDISGGSGSINVKLPQQPAVKLDIRGHGSGGVQFPKDWAKINTGNTDEDEGVWVSPAYAQASRKIEITISHVGSGSISISTE